MARDEVLLDVTGSVAVVTLNAPERRNALTRSMVSEIVDVLDRVEADESVGAVVVTGTPPAFCAGADLSHLMEIGTEGGTDEEAEEELRGIYRSFLRFSELPVVTVAAVNGAAVGAGLNLAMSCDIRLASPRARFDARFLQLGLHPGGGGSWLLHRAVGPQATAAIILGGESPDGAEAARLGLALRCVDDGELLDAAIALAARAASNPRPLIARVKRTLATLPAVADHQSAVDLEIVQQLWSLRMPAFSERVAALRSRISGR